MKFTATLGAVVSLVFSLAIGGILIAGEPSTPDEKKTTGGKKEATEYLEKALQRYRSATSYQDQLKMKMSLVAKDEDNDDAGQENTQEGKTAILMPNRLRFESEDVQHVCDGKQLTIYMPKMDQFVQHKLSGDLSMEDFETGMGGMPISHPVLMAMIEPKKSFGDLFPAIKEIESIEESKNGDRDGMLIRGKMEMENFGVEEPIIFSLWFDAKSGLLGEIRIDMTDAYREMMKMQAEAMDDEEGEKPPTIEKAEYLLTFADAKLNVEIAESVFVFKPEEGARKVDEFEYGNRGDQDKLVGKPAPAIDATDFDGKKVSLEELKGKVVLLDFWATWCGPCVQAIPHIQKLSEKMKDKPVVVLGVNRDQKGSEKKVRKFIEKKKITFGQLEDFENKISDAFKINGIPCTVLIDGKGVVQHINVGFGSGGEEELEEMIEKLIKGENVYDSSELNNDEEPEEEMQIAEADQKGITGDSAEKHEFALTEFEPARLNKGAAVRGVNANIIARVDIDGDGSNELFYSDMTSNPRITIVSATESLQRKIKLAGAGTAQVSDVKMIRVGDEKRLIVALSAGMYGLGSNCYLEVAQYNLDGSLIWSHRIKLKKDSSAQLLVEIGDVTGDAEPEIVFGFTSYITKRSGRSMSSSQPKGYVGVLNAQGQQLSFKKAGQHLTSLAILPRQADASGPIIMVGEATGLRKYSFQSVEPVKVGEAVEAMDYPRDDQTITCASNLRGLGQACFIYAHEHKSKWPPNWQALIDDNSATVKQLKCPHCESAGEGLEGCYVYIPGATGEPDPDRIIAYETRGRHGTDGGFVLRQNGDIEYFEPYSQIQKLVERQQKGSSTVALEETAKTGSN